MVEVVLQFPEQLRLQVYHLDLFGLLHKKLRFSASYGPRFLKAILLSDFVLEENALQLVPVKRHVDVSTLKLPRNIEAFTAEVRHDSLGLVAIHW